ncbi:hypothetical protein Salat_1668300 [Sesamum alatum]|uniref:Uncharacterized protein n=1 Tax=Sesamum alatum TaxID=300844 RepID=A0AAE1Y793_9LAMI|nr:hypothetical protein Salat_1668300 [Sesamum alatum]
MKSSKGLSSNRLCTVRIRASIVSQSLEMMYHGRPAKARTHLAKVHQRKAWKVSSPCEHRTQSILMGTPCRCKFFAARIAPLHALYANSWTVGATRALPGIGIDRRASRLDKLSGS